MKYGIETITYRDGSESRIPVTSKEFQPRSFIKGQYDLPDLFFVWYDSEKKRDAALDNREEYADCCGECKFHRYQNGDWICINKKSEYGGQYTDYSDYCEEGISR